MRKRLDFLILCYIIIDKLIEQHILSQAIYNVFCLLAKINSKS